MPQYSVHRDTDGPFAVVRSPRRSAQRLPHVGHLEVVNSPWKFRGTALELVALDILAHHYNVGHHAVLRGKTHAWTEHRAFLAEIIDPRYDSADGRCEVSSEEIRRFHQKQFERPADPSLFGSEEKWQRIL